MARINGTIGGGISGSSRSSSSKNKDENKEKVRSAASSNYRNRINQSKAGSTSSSIGSRKARAMATGRQTQREVPEIRQPNFIRPVNRFANAQNAATDLQRKAAERRGAQNNVAPSSPSRGNLLDQLTFNRLNQSRAARMNQSQSRPSFADDATKALTSLAQKAQEARANGAELPMTGVRAKDYDKTYAQNLRKTTQLDTKLNQLASALSAEDLSRAYTRQPDFVQASAYVPAAERQRSRGTAYNGVADVVYDYVNGDKKAAAALYDANPAEFTQRYQRYSEASDKDKRVFNYIYNTQGSEAAMEYMDQAEMQFDPAEAFVYNFGQPIMSGIEGVSKLVSGLQPDKTISRGVPFKDEVVEPENSFDRIYNNYSRDLISAQQQQPIASTAGSIASNVAEMTMIASGIGSLPGFARVGNAASRIFGSAQAGMAAQKIVSDAASMAGTHAINEAGAVATGQISGEEYLRDITGAAIRGAAGGAGSLASGMLAGAGMEKLGQIASKFPKLKNNPIAQYVAGTAGMVVEGAGFDFAEALTHIGLDPNAYPDAEAFWEDMIIGFAFSAIDYSKGRIADVGRAPVSSFAEINKAKTTEDLAAAAEILRGRYDHAKAEGDFAKAAAFDAQRRDLEADIQAKQDWITWKDNHKAINAYNELKKALHPKRAAAEGAERAYLEDAQKRFDEALDRIKKDVDASGRTEETAGAIEVLEEIGGRASTAEAESGPRETIINDIAESLSLGENGKAELDAAYDGSDVSTYSREFRDAYHAGREGTALDESATEAQQRAWQAGRADAEAEAVRGAEASVSAEASIRPEETTNKPNETAIRPEEEARQRFESLPAEEQARIRKEEDRLRASVEEEEELLRDPKRYGLSDEEITEYQGMLKQDQESLARLEEEYGLLLHEGSERNDGARAGEQGRPVEAGTGRDQSGNQEARPEAASRVESANREVPEERVESAWQLDKRAKDRSLSKLTFEDHDTSAAELGLKQGTASGRVRLVKGGETRITRRIYGEAARRGISRENVVLFAGGDLSFKEGGVEFGARGAYLDGKIYVRVDDADYLGSQIAIHEATHHLIATGKLNLDSVRATLAKRLGSEAALEEAVALYASAFDGMDASADLAFEEMICDAEAGMNHFAHRGDESTRGIDYSYGQIRESVKETTSRGPPKEGATSINRRLDWGLDEYSQNRRDWYKSSDRITIAESEQDIIDFVNTILEKRPEKLKTLGLGRIGKDLAARIYADTGVQLEGYNVILRSDFENSHANPEKESSRGQTVITPEIIAKVPQVIGFYDSVKRGRDVWNGKPALHFSKDIDGVKIAVEYVSDRNKTIYLQTMYGWASKKNPATTGDVQASPRTSETDSDAGSFTNTIPPAKAESNTSSAETPKMSRRSTVELKADTDSTGRKLTEKQQEYFKDSKVRNDKGELIPMYHGTDADFNVFEFNRGGEHGTAEGFGIYLASNKEVSDHYGGRVIESYVDMKKPARYDEKTLKLADVKKIIKTTCEKEAARMAEDYGGNIKDALRDTWISNYTYTYDKSIENSYSEVARSILEMNENDMDIIQEIMAGQGIRSYEAALPFYDLLTETTGIDGFITSWNKKENKGNSDIIALAFRSNQVKNIGNNAPTENPDIRFSRRSTVERIADGTISDKEMDAAYEKASLQEKQEMVNARAEHLKAEVFAQTDVPTYRVRRGATPKKTIKVYKVFTMDKEGRPTALFVNSQNAIPTGVWLDAQDTFHFVSKENGRMYVPSTKNPNTKGGATGRPVKISDIDPADVREMIRQGYIKTDANGNPTSKTITALAYRPGWHAGDLPFFPQGGMKIEGSNYENVHRYNQVVFECEMPADVDYTSSATIKSGKNQGMTKYTDRQEMPTDGSYKFATNPMANAQDLGSWYIGGSLKINRALSESEVNEILKQNGRLPQEWQAFQEKGTSEKTIGPLDLDKLGYDPTQTDGGKKLLDAETFDDDGNLIPLSQRFNPSVKDPRFSRRSTLEDSRRETADLQQEVNRGLEQRVKDLQKDLEKQTERATKWKRETRRTPEAEKNKVREADAKRVAGRIVKDYGSKTKATDIAPEIRELSEFVRGGGKGSASDTFAEGMAKARQIAEKVISGAEELVEIEPDADTIRSLIGRTMHIAEKDTLDIPDFEHFRRTMFGKMKLVRGTNGVTVDEAYQELSQMYPHYFPREITHPADQVLRMADVLETIKPSLENPYSYDYALATEQVAQDIFAGIVAESNNLVQDSALRTNPPTFADKQQARYEQLIAQNKTKTAEQLARVRQQRDAAIKRLKENHTETSARARERRKATELRGQIQKQTKDMASRLLKPTDKKHFLKSVQPLVAQALDAVNMTSAFSYGADGKHVPVGEGDPTGRTKKFIALREQLKGHKEWLIEGTSLLDDGGSLQKLIDMGDKPISQMTSAELQTVHDALRDIDAVVKNADRTFRIGKTESLAASAEKMRADNIGKKPVGEKLSSGARWMHRLLLDMETPENYFHRFGKVGDQMFRELRNAQDKQTKILKESEDFVKANIKVDPRKVAKQKVTVKLGGKDVTTSMAHLMELYNLCRREQGLYHVLEGGVKFSDPKRFQAAAIRNVTTDELSAAFAQLPIEYKQAADALQKYVSGDLAKHGNEASMEVFGYEKFGNDDYWQIKTDASDRKSDETQRQMNLQNTTVANWGSAKALEPNANSAVVIGDVFDSFAESVSGMAGYAANLAVQQDINRLRNWKFYDEEGKRTGTMKELIDQVHGSGGGQYLEKLMADIAGGMKAEAEYFGGLTGRYKGAAVAANMRVILQQPTAIARAAELIGYKYLNEGLVMGTGKGWKKAKQWAPIAQQKEWGSVDVNTGRTVKEILFKNTSPLARTNDVLMSGAAKADAFGWGLLWNACEAETRAKIPDLKVGSDEYYQHVADRFTGIVDHTQVVDGILQRSQIMRNPSSLTKMATSFMGEPIKQFNQLSSAVYDARTSGTPASKKHLAKTARAMLIAGTLNAVAQSIWDAVRDDDKTKNYLEKMQSALFGIDGTEEAWTDYMKKFFASNMGDFLNPAGYVPYVKDVVSVLQGYDVERMDLAGISGFVTAAQRMIKAMNGEGKISTENALIGALGEGARLLGVPLANLKRDVMAVTNTVANETGNYYLQYKIADFNYRQAGNKKEFMDILYGAYKNDSDAYQLIREDLIKRDELASSSKTTEEYIDEQLRKRMNDDGNGISALYDAQKAGSKEYEEKREELVESGIFTDEQIDKGLKAQYKEGGDLDALYKAYSTGSKDFEKKYDDLLKSGVYTEEQLKDEIENRMKEEQGVTSVKDLDERFMMPAAKDAYNKDLAAVQKTSTWTNASASEREKTEKILYDIATGTKTGQKYQEKIDGGKKVGITGTEYATFLLALEVADRRGNANGSHSKDEIQAALESMAGLSQKEKAYLFGTASKAKNNPYN